MNMYDENKLTAREVGTELGRMFRATNRNGDLDNGRTRLSEWAKYDLDAICMRPASIATALLSTTQTVRDMIAERVRQSNVDTARFAALLTEGAKMLQIGCYEDAQEYGRGVFMGYNDATYDEEETNDEKNN